MLAKGAGADMWLDASATWHVGLAMLAELEIRVEMTSQMLQVGTCYRSLLVFNSYTDLVFFVNTALNPKP